MNLVKFLEKISGSVVHFYPKSGNAGDGFITYATHLIFEKYNISYVAHRQEDYVEDQLVLIGGGGNLVEGKYQEVAELIKKLAPKNKVVLLPHTIVGYADILEETYRNLVVFCREPISYNNALANGANPDNTHLSQDITFFLSDSHFFDFYQPGSGELNIFRSDGESTELYDRKLSASDISLSWNGDIWSSPKFCEYVTKSLAAYIAPYEKVCTDRLHIGILSAFLGKKVRLLPNSYFKNKAVFEHSLSGRFSNIMFEEQMVIAPTDSPVGKDDNQHHSIDNDTRELELVPTDLKWETDAQFIEQCLKMASTMDVVTFDIFDTAITRRVDSPVDIFCEVENNLTIKFGLVAEGFALAREAAERQARKLYYEKRGAEEITLSEIYSELPKLLPKFTYWKEAQACELKIERINLIAVPDILELTRNLRTLGIQYIFVSDMYLPSSFIAEVLSACGYEGWTELYVSSETQFTKASGNIWDYLRKQHDFTNILHIGDDEWSDIRIPKNYQITTVEYTRARSERRVGASLTPTLLPFSRLKRQVELESRCALQPQSEIAFWFNLGQTLGGTIVASFIKWLAERVTLHGIERLYFCSRDGYIIKRAWEAAGLREKTGIEIHYLYISRSVMNIAVAALESTALKLSEATLEYMSQSSEISTIRSMLSRNSLENFPEIVKDAEKTFGGLDRKFVWHEDNQNFKLLLARHSSKVYFVLNNKAELTSRYLKQTGLFDQGRHGIVDLGWHGNLQRALRKITSGNGDLKELWGFYYGLWPAARSNRYLAGVMESCFAVDFLHTHEQVEVSTCVGLLEELHGAPHGSVCGYEFSDGHYQPLFLDDIGEERQYADHISHFQDGIINMISELYTTGFSKGIPRADFTPELARAAIAQVLLSPSFKELNYLGKIGHCLSSDHEVLKPLICKNIPSNDTDIIQELRCSDWLVGQLKHWFQIANINQANKLREFSKTHFSFLGDRRFNQFN